VTVNFSGLPTPPLVADSPSSRRHLLYLLGRIGQTMNERPERTCWRVLGCHAHGLLVDACVGKVHTPEWWLSEAARLDALFPGRHLQQSLPYVTHRVADILSVSSTREDWLSEIVLAAYIKSGCLVLTVDHR